MNIAGPASCLLVASGLLPSGIEMSKMLHTFHAGRVSSCCSPDQCFPAPSHRYVLIPDQQWPTCIPAAPAETQHVEMRIPSFPGQLQMLRTWQLSLPLREQHRSLAVRHPPLRHQGLSSSQGGPLPQWPPPPAGGTSRSAAYPTVPHMSRVSPHL
jgi:hypothetical protein